MAGTARILIIAGSDSGGGAGIQADIKTVTVLGGYAATAITALTAQDTLGVHGIHPVPVDFIRQQIAVVMADIGADCIKIGMLHDGATIEAVAAELERSAPGVPIVLDPVMAAKGGAALLADAAVATLLRRLLPRARLVTPNLPEAAALTGQEVADLAGMERAARRIVASGAKAVLVKGGHLAGDDMVDLLLDGDDLQTFGGRRVPGTSTHGTGCTLASAIATGVGQGLSLKAAVGRAKEFVAGAIAAAPAIGRGHGPLGHNYRIPLS